MGIRNRTREKIVRLIVKDPRCGSNSISLTVSKASFKTAGVGVLLTELAIQQVFSADRGIIVNCCTKNHLNSA